MKLDIKSLLLGAALAAAFALGSLAADDPPMAAVGTYVPFSSQGILDTRTGIIYVPAYGEMLHEHE